MVDHKRATPLTHVRTRIVAGNRKRRGRVHVRDEDTGHSNEASQNHGSVATEAGSHRYEQCGRRTLREQQSRYTEESQSQQTRVLTEQDSRLFLNGRNVNIDNC